MYSGETIIKSVIHDLFATFTRTNGTGNQQLISLNDLHDRGFMPNG